MAGRAGPAYADTPKKEAPASKDDGAKSKDAKDAAPSGKPASQDARHNGAHQVTGQGSKDARDPAAR